ncbi:MULTISPECIES: cytochrome c biogenesis protein ResB [Desulfitobacterium]|uniref:ResB protein required for cytochrome c biosynthesis n=1 Tax=Desulfitobacterium dehalogenans (strain ATCC 51507 / DSM 9161 / JW/IU-DC1) TaxID=756499 RepID=I4AAX5_DESDJ|nr:MULTISPECIES: cytochrome c biogenesis protein ResB [Desulfitobacterium]AFM01110.1 ResB protein required for cytochrome c biosynthesis [Desulfitobacterium dehalogenans ATCC 51507]
MSNRSDGLIEKIWDIFSSMKTGLVLLGVVALVSGIGTLIPQESLDPEGARAVAEIWRTLGFTRIYSSPWFQFLLGLLCINLIVCSVQRFGGIYKLTFHPKAPKDNSGIPQKISAKLSGENEDVLKKRTQEVLKKKGFRITESANEGKWSFTAQKHRMGNWGSFITHISFVILIIGALIGSISGFKGYMMAGEGSVIPIQEIDIYKGQVKENFMVKINSVEDRILANGERDNWYTDLSIIESGTEVHRQSISVNHPLTYKGITFYQTSYAPGALFTVEMDGKTFPVALQNGGGYFNAPGTNLYLVLAAMKAGPQESVILYQVFDENKQLEMGQLIPGESANIQDAYTITFDKATAFTGLQVKADPGVWVVWLGCALLMVGLLLSFYWRPVRIAGILEPDLDTQKPSLVLGAYTGKLNMGVKEEFDRIAAEIRE